MEKSKKKKFLEELEEKNYLSKEHQEKSSKFASWFLIFLFITMVYLIFSIFYKLTHIITILLSFFSILFLIKGIKEASLFEKYSLNLKERTLIRIDKLKFILKKQRIESSDWEDLKKKLESFYADYSFLQTIPFGFSKTNKINRFFLAIKDTLKYYYQKDNLRVGRKELLHFLETLEGKIWSENFNLKEIKIKVPKKRFDFNRIKEILKKKWFHIILILIFGFFISAIIYKFDFSSHLALFIISYVAIVGLLITIYDSLFHKK